jgi:uncharacterized protein YyaL (SSP411 family)
MSNHLANESSPYLLQHAGNPVDWYPWGAEALLKAHLEDKPIFLSIGYAACHWCHVMAHESFEDPATAELMNANFVSIKVDREERPDLDSIYMSFVVATTGQGGWPMSVFLTPDGKPFYGGTYFPPVHRHNLPAFREVLETVARLWQTDRAAILSSSDNLAQTLSSNAAPQQSEVTLNLEILEQTVRAITQSYDWRNGGWGAAPKFPQPMLIEFLLRIGSRGDTSSLEIASHALHSMAQGGMYDILGGGFARYSVDPTWLIPHFEKMLYDNAQLAIVYLHAYLLSGDREFREVCEATLDFVLREMTHDTGGFFSSLDADSEGEEGKYYLWTLQQIRSALSDAKDADLFLAAYGVGETGNLDGRDILRRAITDEQLAAQFHLNESTVANKLSILRQRLFDVRNTRIRPATDDKVLVSWNALMLSALAEAGRSLDRQDYLTAAIRNANFILKHMFVDGRLKRSWREGMAKQDAFLEDYAGLALGFLTLYQADPDPQWYQVSIQLLKEVQDHFTDPVGGFFDTRDNSESLLYRPKDLQDTATPSGGALAVLLLLKLASYENRSDWRTHAETILSFNIGLITRYPSTFAQWLCDVDFALGPVTEVAVLGNLDDSASRGLLEPLWRGFFPRSVIAASSYPPLAGSPALLSDRPLLNGRPTAYVCQGFVCRLPVNEPGLMLKQLAA